MYTGPFLEDLQEALSNNRKQAIAYNMSLENKATVVDGHKTKV
jgi:hypothetical protein